MEEIWKDIPGFEGLYKVSNTGKVFSLKRNHILSNTPNSKGYILVNLLKNGKQYSKKVHRLVMAAFYGDSELEVNHIDGNKTNNNLLNLEYCTHRQNMQHAIRTGLADKRKQVVMMSLDGKILNIFESAKSAAETMGLNYSTQITRVCRGERDSVLGYKWKYREEITA